MKINRQFKQFVEDGAKASKQQRTIMLNEMERRARYTSSEEEKVFNLNVVNWFKEKNISKRRVIAIKDNCQLFIDLFEKVIKELIDKMLNENNQYDVDPYKQHEIMKEYLKEEYILFEEEATICIEFDEPVRFNRINHNLNRASEFTEIVFSSGMMQAYNGITHMNMTSISSSLNKLLLVLLLSSKLNEFIIIEEDKVIKHKIERTSNTNKKVIKGKLVSLWNYETFNLKTETIKREYKPIDMTNREEIILERRPHFRKLRNGEIRYFTGIKAKYYKLKGVEKAGTIVTV